MPEFCVLVLAAGRGERFKAAGGTQHKLDAVLEGKSVRDHVLSAVQASGLPWHMVTPEHTQHLPHAGMADSIACGVAATRNADGWLILPADLPLIQASTLRVMAKALQEAQDPQVACDVVVPFYQQQRGHPVGFSKNCLPDLLQLQGDHGASAVVAKYKSWHVAVNDVGCVTDVDTPALLAAAHRLLQAQRHA